MEANKDISREASTCMLNKTKKYKSMVSYLMFFCITQALWQQKIMY